MVLLLILSGSPTAVIGAASSISAGVALEHLQHLSWAMYLALLQPMRPSSSAQEQQRTRHLDAHTCYSLCGVLLLTGQGSFRDGADGNDLYIKVPVGTIIRKKDAEVMTQRTAARFWPLAM